ncbi:MAG: hypothetical protein KJ645_06235 [Planctomycetes bacterium]|nr:hypothetical protein [Planctomycetota bacterium]
MFRGNVEMSRTALLTLMVGICLLASCSPTPPWTKTYGGPESEIGSGIVSAQDGGYYIVGTRDLRSTGERQANIMLMRIDTAGEVVWEKTFGGEGLHQGRSILRASDGGLLIGAQTYSVGAEETDATLMKVDENGNEIWSRTYTTPLDERVAAVREMPRGGYVLAGSVLDPDDVIADAGLAGYFGAGRRSSPYLVRSDADGNATWSRTFDNGTNTLLSDALPTPDGGVLVLASITYFPDSDDDLYLLRIDEQGNEVWSRTWRQGRRYGHDLIETADGNYLITGSHARAEDAARSEADFLLIKVDPEGNEIWSRTFGDPAMMDWAYGAVGVAEGGFVVAGTRTEDLHGTPENIVFLKVDERGQLLWEREFETGTHNMFGALLQKADGGFVMSGSTRVAIGNFDVFLILTDPEGNAVRP